LAATSDDDALHEQLTAVEKFLTSETSFTDRKLYRGSSQSSRKIVYEQLEKEGARADWARERPPQRREYESRIDLFNAADMLFRFFLPAECHGPTVKQFWGALGALVVSPLRLPGTRIYWTFG
jgi:hypothetical protein